MKRKNTTRNALFTSIISMLLCVSMLVGATFAWFTDSVESGINQIAAGNLDVELYHSKDKDVKIADENKVGSDTLLFTDVNGIEIEHWEPGVVAYTNLKVANVGTLALKYLLSINSTATNYIQYPDGSIYTLADALQVAVVTGGFEGDRTEAQDLAVEWKPLNSFSLPGELNSKEESDTYGIVIYWKPGTNDNIFNMNNGKVTSDGQPLTITLGVNLFATQEMYENDSFGDDYDKLAPWAGKADTEWYNTTDTEFTITSAEELAGLAKIVNSGTDTFVGKTVKLAANIDLNDALWTPIGIGTNGWNSKFNGSFIGTGYTISNLYITGTTGLGLFGYVGNAAHIEGVTIDGAYVSGNDYVGAVVGSGYLAANCVKNCTVMNAEIIATPYLMADGVTYDGGAKAGAIGGLLYNGNISGNKAINCTITAYRDLGGIVGMISSESRQISASGNTVENVTLTYLDLNGAACYENKVNENMGNVIGRLGINASVGENTETNVTRETVIYYVTDGISYAKDVDAGEVTLLGLTADFKENTLNVPEGVTAIGNKALNKKDIIAVTFPSTLTTIGYGAFNTCTSLTSVTIPAGVTLNERTDGNNANTFAGCTSLRTVIIEEGVKSLPKSCFAGCTALTTVTIPASMESLARRAFYDCLSMKTVYLLSENCEIGDSVFGSNQTGKFSEMTIYVVNENMKAAVEATLDDNNKNSVAVAVMNTAPADQPLADSLSEGADTVYLPAGTYTFPTSSLTAGDVILCAPGTVFEGKSSLDIKGASIVGATFSNKNDRAVGGTINGTFKDCTFTGYNALRYCYAGETVVFENCVFSGDVYGIHFDGGANEVTFKNCTFSGFNAMGGAITKLTMEGCTFVANKSSGYNGINLWGDTEMTDCIFVFDGSKTEWVDLCNDGKTVRFTNCVVTDGTTEKGIETVVGNYGDGNTIIVDGKYYVSTAAELAAVVANGATDIYLLDGEYDVYGCGGKTLTISGTKNAVITVVGGEQGEAGGQLDYGFDGSTVTFNGVTIKTNNATYAGYARLTGTYNNCVFENCYCLNSNSVFTNCTFNVSGDQYNVWTWGAPTATFNGCTFNSDGKALLLYGTENTKLTLNGCTFNDKGGLTDLKAAIEIGNDYNKSYELIVNSTVVNGYEINDKGISTSTTLWANKNSMGTDKLNVVVDGVDVY